MRVFDLAMGEEVATFAAAGDTVNGLHFHPCLPLAATASGANPRYLRAQILRALRLPCLNLTRS